MTHGTWSPLDMPQGPGGVISAARDRRLGSTGAQARLRVAGLLALILIACQPTPPPQPPTPPPATLNVACVVSTPDAQPIAGATCAIAGQSGDTNADGYRLFIGVSRGTQTWQVAADGYAPYEGRYDILVSADFPITLTPLEPPLPTHTKAERLAVRCDFAYTEQDGQNSPWQSYAYAGWDEGKRAMARALWKSIGMTHVPVSFALDYPNAGVAPFDFRADPATFAGRLRELQADGFIVFLSAAQAETYGRYPTADRIVADIVRWDEWGWADLVDGAWPGWESNDFLSAQAHVEILHALRQILGRDKVVGVQPGRLPGEGLIYVGGEGYGPEEFWRAIKAPDIAVDALFFEPPVEAFDTDRWRQRLFDALMGASARVYARIDPIPPVFPVPPYESTNLYHENWTRAAPYAGGGVPLVYFEGPAYLRWMSLSRRSAMMSAEVVRALQAQEWGSRRKREAAAVARLVPGVIGSCDGL